MAIQSLFVAIASLLLLLDDQMLWTIKIVVDWYSKKNVDILKIIKTMGTVGASGMVGDTCHLLAGVFQGNSGSQIPRTQANSTGIGS